MRLLNDGSVYFAIGRILLIILITLLLRIEKGKDKNFFYLHC